MDRAIDVANFIIFRERQAGRPLDGWKLQKLLYYVQVYSIKLHGKPAFSDRIEAWKNGPLEPVTWGLHRGPGNITHALQHPLLKSVSALSEQAVDLINLVLTKFGNLSGGQLVELTPQESPWRDLYVPERNIVIPVEAIQESYWCKGGEVMPVPMRSDERQAFKERFANEARVEFEAELLVNENFALLEYVFSCLNLEETALADVLDVIAQNWTKNPAMARRVFIEALAGDSELLQERALHGLSRMRYGGDTEARHYLETFSVERLDPVIHDLAYNLVARAHA